jgi:type VI secretion system protein ImpF
MAELIPRERLQPSLLDRLTDDEPQRQEESREQRVLSVRRLRDGVLRDLGWLLNTARLDITEDLSDHPEVARSVLNYGLPDLTGMTTSGIDSSELEREVRQAIADFEPRMMRNSVRVRVVLDPDHMNRNTLRFEIEADLWAKPLPEQLYLKTEVDLETGSFTIEDRP